MTDDLREELAEALSPSAFNHNHPGYESLSYRIAREEAYERADRVIPVLHKALQQSAEGDVESLGSFAQYAQTGAHEAADNALREAADPGTYSLTPDAVRHIVRALQNNGWRYEG